ncbi:hypothetical protein Pla100_36830 [Neorhodopirellula pilleata]|uniref:Uncharacterized protein n=2 Tax=Neorhodopirellula pilleata TaxID=2714738 RepID=A0A5C6A7P7_9BACT|nr:hypothetical protein Pla100_36830 [Neorhodopirellula pilleata]
MLALFWLDDYTVSNFWTVSMLRLECAFTLIAFAANTGCSHGHDARPAQTDVLLRVCQEASLDFDRERGESPQTLRDLQEFVSQTNWERPDWLTPHTYEYGTRMLRSGLDAWEHPIAVRQLDSPGRTMAWVSAGEDGTFGSDDDREYEMMWTCISDSDD